MAGFTLFDLLVLSIVALSALFAFARGLVRESLTIASWLGALAIAWLAFPMLQPLLRQAIAQEQLADGTTALAGFLVPLVVFKTLSGMIGRAIDGSPVGFLDKLGGLAFGVARGALVVCALYLGSTFVIREPATLPWIKEARLLEPVREGALWLAGILPGDLGGAVTAAGARASRAVDVLRDPASALAAPKPVQRAADGAGSAYADQDRAALSDLVEKTAP